MRWLMAATQPAWSWRWGARGGCRVWRRGSGLSEWGESMVQAGCHLTMTNLGILNVRGFLSW